MDDLATRLHDASDSSTAEEPRQMAIPLDDVRDEELVVEKAPEQLEEEAEKTSLAAGRELALSDFNPPAIGAGERMLRLAYRLGVPGHTLTAPFRKPVRLHLLATVESPLAGDRVAGMALRAGHFLIHGIKAPIGQVDCSPTAKLTPVFEHAVHGFTWLHDLSASGTLPQCAPTAQRILADWMKANTAPGYKGPAWRVENAGHRLLGWLVHAPLVLSQQDKEQRTTVLDAVADTARWLDRNVTRADDRHGEVIGWCAITAAGLLLPEGKPRRLFGEAGLIHALGELVGDDGGVLSRSPLAQMDVIAALVDLSACYRALRLDPPAAIDTMLGLLVPPLLALTHSDGTLGNWQGAGAIAGERLQELVRASGVRTRPLRDPRQWGYQRISSRNGSSQAVLQFDTSPPPLARHARHGCASTLAFEFSHGDHRLVTNCGGAGFAGGQVPTRIEQGLRATAAHSTLVLGDANSTAVLINGKLGNGVCAVDVARRQLETEQGGATRIEASHDGYAQRFGLLHKRILILRDDGSELRGEDLLVPSGRKGKRGKVPYAIRFHLGPQVTLRLADSGKGATLSLPDGSYWQFHTSADTLETEESLWVDGMGRPHPVEQLVIQGLVSRGGGNFGWLLKKMG
ncbi:heparinase II/III family protein [Alteraurantiacibacter aquimixticola]|uniref:Heparinase n=1 Tax=Alteraurantiacibacter aquimixticola TaxID=2489173 RepID=A0A4T3EYW5_9SPHN|nr:heparinase II/III family protein [Alteraurantiacibacter aquimixticola]TIX49059.1 heparinase [Alteraurantiacibacter aquimixticola]